MPRKKLTDLFVERIAPPSKGRLEYFDTTFPALALRVTDTGHKSWSLFYRTAGRLRRYTIGNYPPSILPPHARPPAPHCIASKPAAIRPKRNASAAWPDAIGG